MDQTQLGFTVMALSIVLVGVAVLLLALDTRMTRMARVLTAERLDQHAEVIADLSQERFTRAQHELAERDLVAGRL